MIPVLNRKTDTIPKGAVYVGRPSSFGNPFPIRGANTREVVIEKYRRWFEYKATRDLVFMAALRKLRTATALVCFCRPLACHGTVIAEWLEKDRDKAEDAANRRLDRKELEP